MKKERIKILHDALLIDNSILILSDTHLGYEEHIADKGIFPRIQLKQILEKLENIFSLLKKDNIIIKKIIILGDLKHEFGGISSSEWKESLIFLDYLKDKIKTKEKEIILIKGNHDNILGPIAKKRNIKLKKYYKIKGICFLHGDKNFKECEKANFFIMGHLHPAISLKDDYKKEKYKCFLSGFWKGKRIIIMPSFSPISFGYDLSSINIKDNKDGFLILNNKDIKKLNVIVYNERENKEYDFGKLEKIK